MDLENLIKKRENHLIEYLEFNKIEEPRFGFLDIIEWCKIISKTKKTINILELGTKRSKEDVPTHKKNYFNEILNVNYIMSDYQNGVDVDIVCDIHNIDGVFNDKFDLIICFSVYEHIKYPQLATHNLMKLLNVGGRIYIDTHQTYPLHGYKYDYYRFSREALKSLFSKKMNFQTITSYYHNNCVILPHNNLNNWNDVAESYLHVVYIGEKTDETPNDYIYDIEEK
jgi:SAM-dependent methyltransferase